MIFSKVVVLYINIKCNPIILLLFFLFKPPQLLSDVLFQLWPAGGAACCKERTWSWGFWAQASTQPPESAGREGKSGSAAENSGKDDFCWTSFVLYSSVIRKIRMGAEDGWPMEEKNAEVSFIFFSGWENDG